MNSWHRRWSEYCRVALAGLALASVPAAAADVDARARIRAPADTVLDALEQPCHVRQWMPDLIEVRILDRPAPQVTRVYMASRTPWPFQPRDAITRFERQAGNPVLITLQGEPDALPPRDGFIRIPASSGEWRLLSEGNQTLVTYRLRVDPGGRIPQWLADSASQRRARAAMEALKNYAESPAVNHCLPDEPGRPRGHGVMP